MPPYVGRDVETLSVVWPGHRPQVAEFVLQSVGAIGGSSLFMARSPDASTRCEKFGAESLLLAEQVL
jgi:hypothetical protein